jgi:[acyl-carrier-protein] S-malonyltransferase
MAATLCAGLPAAKELFDRAAAILGYDLLAVCTHGPAERLNATDVSQPAIFVASLAAVEHLKNTEPDAFRDVEATAGLSLGEYTALAFAGAMTFDDALKVVKARGEAMQAAANATPSAMVSVIGMEIADVEALVLEARGRDTLEIANFLCPGNLVVSGSQSAIVAGVAISKPKIPVWSNVDAKPHQEPAELRELLVKQVLAPVRWEDLMRGLLGTGIDRYYEIGPGRVLSGLMKRVNRKADFRNVWA